MSRPGTSRRSVCTPWRRLGPCGRRGHPASSSRSPWQRFALRRMSLRRVGRLDHDVATRRHRPSAGRRTLSPISLGVDDDVGSAHDDRERRRSNLIVGTVLEEQAVRTSGGIRHRKAMSSPTG
jgi:hypothetical protein